jgi:hypothetical protein
MICPELCVYICNVTCHAKIKSDNLMVGFWIVIPCLLLGLKIEAVCSSKMLVPICKSTQCQPTRPALTSLP